MRVDFSPSLFPDSLWFRFGNLFGDDVENPLPSPRLRRQSANFDRSNSTAARSSYIDTANAMQRDPAPDACGSIHNSAPPPPLCPPTSSDPVDPAATYVNSIFTNQNSSIATVDIIPPTTSYSEDLLKIWCCPTGIHYPPHPSPANHIRFLHCRKDLHPELARRVSSSSDDSLYSVSTQGSLANDLCDPLLVPLPKLPSPPQQRGGSMDLTLDATAALENASSPQRQKAGKGKLMVDVLRHEPHSDSELDSSTAYSPATSVNTMLDVHRVDITNTLTFPTGTKASSSRTSIPSIKSSFSYKTPLGSCKSPATTSTPPSPQFQTTNYGSHADVNTEGSADADTHGPAGAAAAAAVRPQSNISDKTVSADCASNKHEPGPDIDEGMPDPQKVKPARVPIHTRFKTIMLGRSRAQSSPSPYLKPQQHRWRRQSQQQQQQEEEEGTNTDSEIGLDDKSSAAGRQYYTLPLNSSLAGLGLAEDGERGTSDPRRAGHSPHRSLFRMYPRLSEHAVDYVKPTRGNDSPPPFYTAFMYDSAERAPDGLPASPERLSRRDETADASSHARTNSSASSSLSLSRLSLLKQKSRKFSFHSQQQSTGSEGKDKRAPGARTHRSASSPLANDELQQQQQHKGQGVGLSRLQSLALRSFKPRPRRDSQLATVDSDP